MIRAPSLIRAPEIAAIIHNSACAEDAANTIAERLEGELGTIIAKIVEVCDCQVSNESLLDAIGRLQP